MLEALLFIKLTAVLARIKQNKAPLMYNQYILTHLRTVLVE